MAVTTHATMPVEAIVPENQPIQNACALVLPSSAQCNGTRAIQANSPRSDFGKLSGRNSPLAPARTSERAREWVMSRTLTKAREGCNIRFGVKMLVTTRHRREERFGVDALPLSTYNYKAKPGIRICRNK